MASGIQTVRRGLQTKSTIHCSSGLIPAGIPTVAEIEKSFGKRVHKPKGSIHEYRRGSQVLQTLKYTCDPSQINQLPFSAKSLCFYVSNINWSPGAGWPIYHTYCPTQNLVADMRYPNAFAHQIVPIFGGFYWVGCANPACGTGNQETPVYFAVNDNNGKYGDNLGYFDVEITSYQ